MDNIIDALGLDGVSVNTERVKDLSLMEKVLTSLIDLDVRVSHVAHDLCKGLVQRRYSIRFESRTSMGRLDGVYVSFSSNMTYTEFRKKYKNLPQFLEQWKKHKEANG